MFQFTVKNMLRYKMRSLLTFIVIAISAYTSILSLGFQTGLLNIILDSFINYQTGHIRITSPEYLQNERFLPSYYNMTNLSEIKNKLEQIPEIKSVVPRYQFFGFVSYNEDSFQTRIITLDLTNNRYDFERYLTSGVVQNQGVLMGKQFAEKINADLQEPIMVVGTTIEGGINANKPLLAGTYHYNMKLMDQKTIIIDFDSGQRLLRTKDSAAEILVYLHDDKYLDQIVQQLQTMFPNFSIESYKKQFGSLYAFIELQSIILFMITAFVMFLGSLIIVNSMLAGIYERMPEFGMMKAIGFMDKEISSIFLIEGMIYGLVGGTIGFTLGVININYLSVHGLDITKIMANSNLPVSSILYPHIDIVVALFCYGIIIVIPALVALFPARYIKKITPLEALLTK